MARRTLITVAVALTVVAFIAAEADFWSADRFTTYDTYSSTLLTSFRVAHRGDIELDENQTRIVSMTPDAYLEVAERRFLTRRRLRVRAGRDGQPEYEIAVGSRDRGVEEAREFLAQVMPQVVNSTTIGARPRAERILATQGLEALTREVGRLDSNAARRIYLEVAAGYEGLTEAQGSLLIRTAGQEMTSSSGLRAVLVVLAQELPAEWRVTGDLLTAAEAIASSSAKGTALVKIVRLRGLEPGDVRPGAEAVATIASGSEKGRAIVSIAALQPSSEVVGGLLDAADTIDSSSERRRVLEELIGIEGLDASAFEKAIDVGSGISASSEKASFLAALAPVMPADLPLQQGYLDLAGTIPASSEQSRALTALLRSGELAPSICADWIRTAGAIPVSSSAASLLVDAALRCPNQNDVWREYLAAVRGISASSEQRRALMALLERDGLGRGLIADTADVAETAIGSASERQTVLDRAARLLDEPVEPAPESTPGGERSPTDAASEASELEPKEAAVGG